MGKRQIGDMQPNELIVTLLISELVAICIQDLGQPISLSMVSIFILVFLEILVSFITMKFPKVKRIFSGEPITIIDDGKINQKNMERLRMSSLDLMQLLRNQGVFDINDVYCAVMEVNGSLSIQLKTECQPITKQEPQNSLPYLVISDGKIINGALKDLGINKNQLTEKVNGMGLALNDIYFMTLDSCDKSVVVKKDVTE